MVTRFLPQKASSNTVLLALAGAAATAFAAAVWTALEPDRAGLSLLLAVGALLVAGFAWLETGPGSAKEIALIATLAGAAAAGRVLFQAVPGVQPVTVITVAAGAALGARAGFAVGALSALVSNFFLGQGTWTPWQMVAWGGCGVAGAALAPLLRGRVSFAALCFVLGFAFSTLMDFWLWLSFYPHTWEALVVVLGRGVWFSAAHAIGNVLLALVAGPELRRLLERYGRRLRTEVAWA
jgi:energy-coupling factor transport system substrate-specific component